jgi:hypothetical protein
MDRDGPKNIGEESPAAKAAQLRRNQGDLNASPPQFRHMSLHFRSAIVNGFPYESQLNACRRIERYGKDERAASGGSMGC